VSLVGQNAIDGILLGLLYALMAVGLTLEFGVLKIANFAYGFVFIVGGYLTYTVNQYLGLNFWLSILVSFVALFAIGAVIERIGFAHFRGSEMATLVFGVGLMLFGRAAIMLIWGSEGQQITPPVRGAIIAGQFAISWQRLVAAAVSVLLVFMLWLFLRYTTLGKTMRCVSDSPRRAELLGINSLLVYMLAMGVGSAVAAVGASFIGTIMQVGPGIDMTALLKGFVIIILAGMGSLPGAVVGGLIIGLLEAYASSYLGATMGYVIPFAIMVIVLLVRPQGIFGRRERVG